jgi:hypothetical protein
MRRGVHWIRHGSTNGNSADTPFTAEGAGVLLGKKYTSREQIVLEGNSLAIACRQVEQSAIQIHMQ